MKAFLSHSSKDKSFVEKVAQYLGSALCEYDQYTFEYKLTSQAIRDAFARCNVFVLFLSENSIQSNFVSEEMRTALDFRGLGTIKKTIIIALDNTSYQALPEWMRDINVASKLISPLTVGRKIETALLAAEAEQQSNVEIYVPREAEEQALRRALSKPPGEAPISIHAVGHLGIGRRTFIRKTLSAVYPRQIQTFIHISLGKFEGVNEFYRRLYEHYRVTSINEKIANFDLFQKSDEEKQVASLLDLFTEIAGGEECILVEDEGGVYTDDGEYQAFLASVIEGVRGASRPLIAFAQTRMMPLRFRGELKHTYHTFLNPLDDTKISELVSFNLKDAGLDFSSNDLKDICSLLDGNPINVKLAMNAIRTYGLQSFLADPSLLIEWKRRRAEDFLSKIEFNKIEEDIMSMLIDYRFITFSLLRNNVGGEVQAVTSALRKLEDFCCIERKGDLYSISPPIHDGSSRDKRFRKSDDWKRRIAINIVQSVSQYEGDESAPVALLEVAATASIISAKSQTFISQFILPSYYVALARNAYDDDRRKQAIDFCKRAYELKNALSVEAKIEALRIWGLSAIRIADEEGTEFALRELATYGAKKIARRHAYFIRGFAYRLRKRYDDAEHEFLEAHKLARGNLSINRELASLYRRRGEFVEAEGYARTAYEILPTNPYVLDVLLESLLGKSYLNMAVDQNEIIRLFDELKRYGDVPGSSFYQARMAQDFLRRKNKPQALAAANKAIERTPEFLPCYFMRADIYIGMANATAARNDLDTINSILQRRGGFSEEDEGKTVEVEVGILTEERNFRAAREKLNNSQFIPRKTAVRLAKRLALAISYESEKADRQSRDWAHKLLGGG